MWLNLEPPICGLAPMDGVTDAAFRQMVVRHGKPDVIFTEFTSVEGICAGAEKPLKAFIFAENEHPIIAQLFGTTPDCFYKSVFVLAELGFDGIDINMGCPAKVISQKGAGAGLIQTPTLAVEIINASKQAAEDWHQGKTIESLNLPPTTLDFISKHKPLRNLSAHATHKKLLPISVKTRTGYHKQTVIEWMETLVSAKPAAITLHGRTYAQMYTGLADYESITKAADIVKKNNITFLGNGDIKTIEQGKELAAKHNLDGFLIGRSALGNPWLFSEKTPTVKEKLLAAIDHCKLHDKLLPMEPFVALRKHLSWYCRGFPNATDIRLKLMNTKNTKEVSQIIMDLINQTDTITP